MVAAACVGLAAGAGALRDQTPPPPPPTPWPCLDDADMHPAPAPAPGTVDLASIGFPRVGLMQPTFTNIPGVSDRDVAKGYFAKYDVLQDAATKLTDMADIQKKNPKIVFLRYIGAHDYLGWHNNTFNFPFGTTPCGSEPRVTNREGAVFAGHWLYRAGATLAEDITADQMSFTVKDGSRLKRLFADSKTGISGAYAVLYDATNPSHAFDNAEHVFVTKVQGDKVTLSPPEDVYKGQGKINGRALKSVPCGHKAGAVIALHVIGGCPDLHGNWVFNWSDEAPKDEAGQTMCDIMPQWLKDNIEKAPPYNTPGRKGVGYDPDPKPRQDGIIFDADISERGGDLNNDLVEDPHGIYNGVNHWCAGMEIFYQRCHDLMGGPDAAPRPQLVVGGSWLSRGFASLNGTQEEDWTVHFKGPEGIRVDSFLSEYGTHVHRHEVGPAYTEEMNKPNTKMHPTDDNPYPDSRFRVACGSILLEDGFFDARIKRGGKGRPNPDLWWDEFAVDTAPGSPTFGHAIENIPANNWQPSGTNKLYENHHWLGQPLGRYFRCYDPAQVGDPLWSAVDGAGVGWLSQNVSARLDSAEGNNALKLTVTSPGTEWEDATAKTPSLAMTSGESYTLCFRAKTSASPVREINVGFEVDGNEKAHGLQGFLLTQDWRRCVITVKAQGAEERAVFQLGRDAGDVWIDDVYLFRGNLDVIAREFEHGAVVVNLTDAPRSDLAPFLHGQYQRIHGSPEQQPKDWEDDPDHYINSGQNFEDYHNGYVAAMDAAILVRRASAQSAPGGDGTR